MKLKFADRFAAFVCVCVKCLTLNTSQGLIKHAHLSLSNLYPTTIRCDVMAISTGTNGQFVVVSVGLHPFFRVHDLDRCVLYKSVVMAVEERASNACTFTHHIKDIDNCYCCIQPTRIYSQCLQCIYVHKMLKYCAVALINITN